MNDEYISMGSSGWRGFLEEVRSQQDVRQALERSPVWSEVEWGGQLTEED